MDDARIRILGESARSLTGLVVGMDRRSLTLRLASSVAEGAAVQIETGDTLLLGEVCHSADGVARIKVLHSLHSLAELARLNRRLLGTELRALKNRDRQEADA